MSEFQPVSYTLASHVYNLGPSVSRSNCERVSPIVRSFLRQILTQAYTARCDLNLTQNSPELVDQIDLSMIGYFSNNPTGYLRQYLRIIHHISPLTWTGYYSIHFNRTLLQNRVRVVSMSQSDCFPEVYANDYLTDDRVRLLDERISHEYQVLEEAFTRGLDLIMSGQVKLESIAFFRRIDNSSYSDDRVDDLYSQSYRRIYLRTTRDPIPTRSCPCHSQIIFELSSDGYSNITSVNMMTLLTGVHQGQMNPVTHRRIDPGSLQIITSKYRDELDIVKFNVNPLTIRSSDVHLSITRD